MDPRLATLHAVSGAVPEHTSEGMFILGVDLSITIIITITITVTITITITVTNSTHTGFPSYLVHVKPSLLLARPTACVFQPPR